jgi:hypothetical protein
MILEKEWLLASYGPGLGHSLSKHGLETPVKSLFYLFVRVYAVLCTVMHSQWTHCISI